MDGTSDEDLMRLVMHGDRHALSTLVERHYDAIRSYLVRLLQSNHALAEDLAQEAFLAVLRQQSYRADRAFLPWLYAIATNLARDHFKSATVRYTTRVPEASWQALIDTSPNPEATIDYLARLGRRSRCFSRSLAALKLFIFAGNRRQLAHRASPRYPAHVRDFVYP